MRRLLFLVLLLTLTFTLLASEQIFAYPVNGSSIKIDGLDNDWPSTVEWKQISYVNTSPTLQPLTSNKDFWGRFKVAYDRNKHMLYVFVQISDDKLYAKSSSRQTGWLWDHLEIFIDGKNSKSKDKENFHQFIISPIASVPPQMDNKPISDKNEFDSTSKYAGHTISYEIAIFIYTKRAYNWPHKMENKSLIGFDISYTDNDGDNFGKEGSYISWVPGTAKHLSSQKYGELIFLEDQSQAFSYLKEQSDNARKFSLSNVSGLAYNPSSNTPQQPKPTTSPDNNKENPTIYNWFQDYNFAIQEAKRLNRNIFLFFHADIDRSNSFENNILNNYKTRIFSKFIPLKLNISSYREIATKIRVYRIPSIVIIDSNGNLISNINTNDSAIEKIFQ